MKLATSIASTLCFTYAVAQQSMPFFLVIKSDNSTLNGSALDAGHEGAGIEGLLVGPKLAEAEKDPQYYLYNYNYTGNNAMTQGFVTWTLPGGNFNESEGMTLFADPGTNVGLALFEPSDNFQYVSWDDNEDMFIQSYMNDEVVPPNVQETRNLYRWSICNYDFEGYLYPVLCWTYGKYQPENPTCQPVNVTRVFQLETFDTKSS